MIRQALAGGSSFHPSACSNHYCGSDFHTDTWHHDRALPPVCRECGFKAVGFADLTPRRRSPPVRPAVHGFSHLGSGQAPAVVLKHLHKFVYEEWLEQFKPLSSFFLFVPMDLSMTICAKPNDIQCLAGFIGFMVTDDLLSSLFSTLRTFLWFNKFASPECRCIFCSKTILALFATTIIAPGPAPPIVAPDREFIQGLLRLAAPAGFCFHESNYICSVFYVKRKKVLT